jgi:hypothetical protein
MSITLANAHEDQDISIKLTKTDGIVRDHKPKQEHARVISDQTTECSVTPEQDDAKGGDGRADGRGVQL